MRWLNTPRIREDTIRARSPRAKPEAGAESVRLSQAQTFGDLFSGVLEAAAAGLEPGGLVGVRWLSGAASIFSPFIPFGLGNLVIHPNPNRSIRNFHVAGGSHLRVLGLERGEQMVVAVVEVVTHTCLRERV
jgi:hypothetical protein